jgi:hypothetical protein
MKQILFTAVAAVTLLTGFAHADDVETDADLDFYHGQVLYEHESCGIKFVVDAPEIDHLYINDELVAVIDYRGEFGFANGLSKAGAISLEVNGSTDPVSDYLDSILQENGIPPYQELSPSSCISS